MSLTGGNRQMPIAGDSESRRQAVKAVSASGGGQRLYPSRSSRVYWILRRLRYTMQSIIEEYLSADAGGILVDYGCGDMPYRPLFEPRVDSYIGCDLEGNELADRMIRDIKTLPIDSGTVDWVLSTQVLEHVHDPSRYLQEAHRVLKDDGHVILSTHGSWRFHPDPCDFWRWTSDGLKKQVEDAGFDVLTFRGILGPAATGLQLWQDAVLRGLSPRARSFFAGVVQYAIRWADMRCSDEVRDQDACVYVLVAKARQSTV